MSPKSEYTALIDGDVLAYRAAFSCEEKEYTYTHLNGEHEPKTFRYIKDAKEYYKEDIIEYRRKDKTIVHPPEWAIHYIRTAIDKLLYDTGASNYRVFLGGADNFRMDVFPQYKAGRAPKPTHLSVARDYLVAFHKAEIVQGEEADDALGRAQTDSSVICSVDKDLLQIPGANYNWVTGQWNYMTEREAKEWFWIQMLTGDMVDNIRGLRGIGPLKAEALIQMFNGNFCQIYKYVLLCYREEFHGGKEFFINMQLLFIQRGTTNYTIGSITKEIT